MLHFDPSTLHRAFEISIDGGMYNARDFISLCDRIGKRKPLREPDKKLAARLLYRCEVVKLPGASYRMENRKTIFKNESKQAK